MRFPSLPLLLMLLGLSSFAAQGAAQSCAPDSTTLCLNQGRFEVSVSWKAAGDTGTGQAVSLTDDAGAFWFFSAENLELVVKVLDGRAVNGAFWVFYGALSNVEYTILVTDSETGATKSYVNLSGTLASAGDTSAFPSTVDATSRLFHVDRTAFPALADDPLKASFTVSPTSPVVNTEVTFTDTSEEKNPDLRCWNFGDGTGACASSDPVATHTYTVGRTYLVSLLLRRFGNQTVTESKAFRNVIVAAAGGSPCSYSVTPAASSFPAEGGTGKLTVSTSSSDCKWTATSNSAFITIQSGANGKGNEVQYQVGENTGNSARTGTLRVAGVTVTVTQAKACATLSPQSATFEAAGGSGEITVSAPGSCKWTAKSNSSFLVVASGASGKGDGQVRYEVAAYRGHTDRKGTLTVAGKSFEVTQRGLPCSYALTPDVTAFDSFGGVGLVSVATDSDCSWQATSDALFLEAAGTGSGQGNGTVTFCMAANRGAARAASLSIGGETVALTQSAPGVPPVGSSPEALCLMDRFEALVQFRDADGQNQTGKPMLLTPQTGYFTFFNSANIELMMKLLDGREVNGHYWFFYGSLSNIAYAVTLTDTETGDFQLYCNPSGTFQSLGDTSALPPQ